MITYFKSRSKSLPYRVLSAFVAFTFLFSYIVPPSSLYAQGLPATVMNLPVPGTPVPLTPGFTPARIIGMTIHADNPLMFDFMVDPGDMKLNDQQTQDESLKLVKYFLASLTVPAEKLWVNLSPYEKDKIVPEEFGQTEMGADLLAQDYMLKQLTASLMNPEDELGKKFWDRVYEKAQKLFGTTEIPLNTFNKVWIVPEKAVVYANGLNVFILESRFKVMMEEDYLALQYHAAEHPDAGSKDAASGISSSIIKEVLLPEIEKEVNEGKTFANLRQIHNSLILAAWYKQNLKESLLGQIYADKAKTGGLTVADKETSRKIYDQYVEAFQKGVHNFIKEDYDPATKQIIPRKYFSGGVTEEKLEIEDRASVDPKILKAFASGAAGASVITAGLEGPGKEISFKMPFHKTTPSAEPTSSPLNAARKSMFAEYSQKIGELHLTSELKRKMTDLAMIGQISEFSVGDSVFEGVLDQLFVIGKDMEYRASSRSEASFDLISLFPLILKKASGQSLQIIQELVSLHKVVVSPGIGQPFDINKELYEWVIENEPGTEIAGDFRLVKTLLEARAHFSSDDIAMLKREILGTNPPASLPEADLEKLARRLGVEPEYVDGVIEEYARAVGKIVERIPVVGLSSGKKRKAVDLFMDPSSRPADVIIGLIHKQEYVSKERINELRGDAWKKRVEGLGVSVDGVGLVAVFWGGEKGLERLYGKTVAEDLRGDFRLLRELLGIGLPGLTLTPGQMSDKTAIRNVIKDTILAASSPVMEELKKADAVVLGVLADRISGEIIDGSELEEIVSLKDTDQRTKKFQGYFEDMKQRLNGHKENWEAMGINVSGHLSAINNFLEMLKGPDETSLTEEKIDKMKEAILNIVHDFARRNFLKYQKEKFGYDMDDEHAKFILRAVTSEVFTADEKIKADYQRIAAMMGNLITLSNQYREKHHDGKEKTVKLIFEIIYGISASSPVVATKQDVRTWSGFDDLKPDETIKITAKPSGKDLKKRVSVAEVGHIKQTVPSSSWQRLKQELTKDIYTVELKDRTGKNNLLFNIGSDTDGLSWISVFQSENYEFVGTTDDEKSQAINVAETMKTLTFRVFEGEKRIEVVVSEGWFDLLTAIKGRKLITDAELETLVLVHI